MLNDANQNSNGDILSPLLFIACIYSFTHRVLTNLSVKSFSSVRRLKNASFEIVPADSGMFEVSAKFMGIPMEKVEIVFQVRYL